MIIIIDGVAGSGKSTLTWYLANHLSKMGVKKVNVIDEPLSKSEITKLRATTICALTRVLNNEKITDEGVTFVTRQRQREPLNSFAAVASQASGRHHTEENMYVVSSNQKKLKIQEPKKSCKKVRSGVLQAKTCPYCRSHKVEVFDSDNDCCMKCGKWFTGGSIKSPKSRAQV